MGKNTIKQQGLSEELQEELQEAVEEKAEETQKFLRTLLPVVPLEPPRLTPAVLLYSCPSRHFIKALSYLQLFSNA